METMKRDYAEAERKAAIAKASKQEDRRAACREKIKQSNVARLCHNWFVQGANGGKAA